MSFQLDHREPPLWAWWQRALAAFFVALLGYASVVDAAPPVAAKKHQRALTANAHAVWGLAAPIATFAAQVHQESGWKEDARSPFAGGLAQFTPDTAKWISKAYNDELPGGDPFNPSWALRALVRYDKHLWDRVLPAANDCERMAFVLSSYNGGKGWLDRDKARAAQYSAAVDRWFGNVEFYNAGRAAHFFEENRGYPRRILLKIQKEYATWGPAIECKEVT